MLKLIKLVLFLIFCSRRSRSPGSGGGGGSNNLLIYSWIILYCSCELNCGNTHFKCRYDHRICHSRVKMSSTKWAAPNIRVLIANLIEHWRANAETIESSWRPKIFYRVNSAIISSFQTIWWMFVKIDYSSLPFYLLNWHKRMSLGSLKWFICSTCTFENG